MRDGNLAGRVAVVTGGCGGIGTAVCARFAAEGAAVYATGLAAHSGDLTCGVTFHRHDVTREESAVALMARIEREHGRLHVLVNAAGIEIEQTVEHTSLEEWNRIFAVNVTGTFLTSKHALPLMRKAGGGSIINFGSYDGFIADPNLAAYCATKGAVHALTRAMACDHGPDNIRVNAICPGYVDTPDAAELLRFDERGRTPRERGAARASLAALRHAAGHGEPGQLAGRRRGALRVGSVVGSGRRPFCADSADAGLSRRAAPVAASRRSAPPAPVKGASEVGRGGEAGARSGMERSLERE